MEAKQVLIIENEEDMRDLLGAILVHFGFGVCLAADGEQGLREFARHPFDLVLLDIMMPRMSGWEVLRQLRQCSDVPILIVSALFRQEYLTHADQSGVGFLTKPFNQATLLAAVEVALRWSTPLPGTATMQPVHARSAVSVARSAEQPETALAQPPSEPLSMGTQVGHLQIDLATRRVLVQGKRVKLTATEYRLLEYLVNHAGQVLTYQQILQAVWGWEYRNSTHYVHVFISQLRQKLEVNPDEPRYLLTERGVGYSFIE